MGGAAQLQKQSEGAALRRRVSFGHVQAIPHLKKGPASTAWQSALLHSPPSHPMRTRFGRVHSHLHSHHLCFKELPWSEHPQNSHTPPPVLAHNPLKVSAHSDQSVFQEAMKRGPTKIDKIDNFPPEKKMRRNVTSSSSRSSFSPEYVARQVPANHPRESLSSLLLMLIGTMLNRQAMRLI